jgi:REP element-mobilizing transposase RayT
MVRAYHAIFTAYGFWLPNDPRGSWSDFVRSWELLKHGRATKTSERRSLAGNPHDVAKRKSAKSSLRYPAVVFDGTQAMQCIQGFAAAIDRSGYTLHACSILPDHVHVVVRRHWQRIEQIVGQLKGEATKRLVQAGLHPLSEFVDANSSPLPSPRARKCWKVFLNSDGQIRRAIRYVEQNPVKDRKRPQRWSFVVPFESG